MTGRPGRTIRLLPLLVAAACGTGKESSTPHERGASAAGSAGAPVAAAARPACPKTGHWSPCQVKMRLEQAGVAPRDSSLDDLPKLGPAPIVYAVGNAPLAIYLFPDAAARERAARALDTTRFIAPNAALSMRHEATAIQNDNLLGLLFTQRDQQRERVSDALSAGAPQP